ncbi:MAG: 4'-phosphopantetheinyl transferase superfamily protein [Nitrospirales bacterium]
MKSELKQVVAELFDADLQKVNADFVLSTRRMQGSLARAKLDAAIRHRLGIKCRVVYSAKTYGELENAVLGLNGEESKASSSNAVIAAHDEAFVAPPEKFMGLPSGFSCGIDIELVENFPEVDDYWNDAFYTNSFSSVEIAYCLLQGHPRMHFAARWCAKEALKKSHQAYLNEEMKNLEFVSNEGAPPTFRHYINGIPTPIPFAVSVSHTSLMAIAMVVKQIEV